MPRPAPIEVDFAISQIVATRLSPDEFGLVTGIHVRDGAVTYSVTWPSRMESPHYAFELRPAGRAAELAGEE